MDTTGYNATDFHLTSADKQKLFSNGLAVRTKFRGQFSKSSARPASTGLMAIIESGGFGMAVACPGCAIVDDGRGRRWPGAAHPDRGPAMGTSVHTPHSHRLEGTMDLTGWAIWQATSHYGHH